MYPNARILTLRAGLFLAAVGSLAAAAANTYQVTGPILALTSSTITVQKNDEKWEIARDPSAKGDSALKVGDRVTIHYRMVATRVDSNPGKADETKVRSESNSAPTSKTKKSADR